MTDVPAQQSRGAGRPAIVVMVVVGTVVGWLAGRQSVELPPPPPPAEWVNPLADTTTGETLRLRYPDGVVDTYLVVEAVEDSVLLRITKTSTAGTSSSRELRVSRNFPGVFIVLDGDIPKDALDAGLRNFRVDRMVRERITVGSRSHDAWRIEGRHLRQGAVTIWVDPEMPVHGVLRMAADRGVLFEVEE